jgi:predicted nuclease of predicted toxin-antitoxin system
MASFYADEDFDYPVVVELRQIGHDVLTVQEAGQKGQKDPVVLAFASAQGRAVLTYNRRHFIRLHRQTPSHGGIVICTRDKDFVALAGRIHQAVAKSPSLANQLLRIYRPSVP